MKLLLANLKSLLKLTSLGKQALSVDRYKSADGKDDSYLSKFVYDGVSRIKDSSKGASTGLETSYGDQLGTILLNTIPGCRSRSNEVLNGRF